MAAPLCYSLLAPAQTRRCASAGQGGGDPELDIIRLMRRSKTMRCRRGCAWGLRRGLWRILRRTHLCGVMHSRRGCANRSRSPGTRSNENAFPLEVSRRCQRCAQGIRRHSLAKKRKRSYTPVTPSLRDSQRLSARILSAGRLSGGCNCLLAGDLRPRQKIQTLREEVSRHNR